MDISSHCYYRFQFIFVITKESCIHCLILYLFIRFFILFCLIYLLIIVVKNVWQQTPVETKLKVWATGAWDQA